MSYKEPYIKAIIEVLSKGDYTFDEIKSKLKEGGLKNYWLMREALLELLKKGLVEKYPDYEKKKFRFRLKKP